MAYHHINKLKVIISRFVALVILLLILCFVPVPISIDKNLKGILWDKDNASYKEETEITVKGVYYRYIIPIFKYDSFKGKIEISNFDFTSDYSMWDITLDRSHYNSGSLSYTNFSTNADEIVGLIGVRKSFSEIAIIISPSSTSEPILGYKVISAPAYSRQDAIDLAISVFSNDFGFQ